MDKLVGCYFPTTVYYVDDNSSHLNSIAAELDSAKVVIKLYTDAIEAIDDLTKSSISGLTQSTFLSEDEDSDPDHKVTDIDVRSIHKVLFDPNRFKQVSIVITDYNMPRLNGIDFCKKIHDINVKKVMLTGEASAELAVQAFNHGLIHKFIRKDASNFSGLLNQTVFNLQQDYFDNLIGAPIHELVSENSEVSVINEPAFLTFFSQLCKKNNIVEYYLLDNNGSLLLVDWDGTPYFLIIKHDELINDFYLFAEGEGAPDNVKSDLINRRKIPFFYSNQDMQTPPSEWHDYLYPAKPLNGANKSYFYSLISGNAIHKFFDVSKIISYKSFLKNLG